MNCQSLFSGENKENISNCHLLTFLPSMQCLEIHGLPVSVDMQLSLSIAIF